MIIYHIKARCYYHTFGIVRLRVLPEFPNAGHPERLAPGNDNLVLWLLCAFGSALPLEDRVGGHPMFDYRVGYRRLLEIQARLLARFLNGEIDDYSVFVAR